MSLKNNIPFPPAYKKAMIDNLAIDLCPDYGVMATPDLKADAAESMRIIENINSRNKRYLSNMDFTGKQRTFNIYTGLDD
jgi:hypothetical protein